METVAENEVIQANPAVKKIQVGQRRIRFNVTTKKEGWAGFIERIKTDSQYLRQTVQFIFFILTLIIGIQFYCFVKWLESGGNLFPITRPPGVEAFLPIGALISLKYWFQTGIINDIHPSGLFIFIAILTMSVLLKKSFCSWICPVGYFSEKCYKWGEKLFGRNFKIPKWPDRCLRGIKFFLLGFFLWAIVWVMDSDMLAAFIHGPYNKVADIKMLYFFTQMTKTTVYVLFILVGLSFLFKNFWCRYLCPYGALLGLISRFSPVKITRNPVSCIDCQLCTRACPSFLPVHKLSRITHDECTACLNCMEVCPVKDTLDLRTSFKNKKIPVPVFASLIIGIFITIIGFAMLTGHWENNISMDEYISHIHQLNGPEYRHH